MNLIPIKYRANPLYLPLYKDKSEHLVLWGGGSSGKSTFVASKLIYRILKEHGKHRHKFLALRKVGDTVRDSVYAELVKATERFEVANEFHITRNPLELIHRSGNKIICRGLDDPSKSKSFEGITGVWFEEATDFMMNDYDEVNRLIRGQREFYAQSIYSSNPMPDLRKMEENPPFRQRFLNQAYPGARVIFSTHKDNGFLTERDHNILEGYKDKNPLFYQIYTLGNWPILNKSNKFLYSYSDEMIKEWELNDNLPLWASWDFNKDPMTCIVGQRLGDKQLGVRHIFKIESGSTPEMCDVISAKFPNKMFVMTGDATGRNRSALIRGNINHWIYIQKYFGLHTSQLKVRGQNISLINSRILVNSVAQNTELIIHPDCKELIDECKFAKVDDYGELVKDREKNKMDFFDCLRYFIDANYPEFIAKLHKL
jgi:hypothetical protein